MLKKARIALMIVAAALVVAIALVALLWREAPDAAPEPTLAAEPLATSEAPEPTPEPTPSYIEEETMPDTGRVTAAALEDIAAPPQDVIRYYFQRWQDKDVDGMEACLVAADRGLADYDDLGMIDSVTLLAMRRATDADAQAGFDPEWYEGAAEVAQVLVDCAIAYNAQGQDFYVTDGHERLNYPFWLVRESQEGGWRIAMQGY